MMLVVLSFESGERREVELAGVPRRGDYIRLSDVLSEESSLEVEHVLWLEETAITKKAVSITGPNSPPRNRRRGDNGINIVVVVRKHRDTRTLT